MGLCDVSVESFTLECFLNFGEISDNKNKANASISICLIVHCYFIGIAGCGVTVYVMVVTGSSP